MPVSPLEDTSVDASEGERLPTVVSDAAVTVAFRVKFGLFKPVNGVGKSPSSPGRTLFGDKLFSSK